MATQTGSKPYVNKTGPNNGIIINIISMKSKIKPNKNITLNVIINMKYLSSDPYESRL